MKRYSYLVAGLLVCLWGNPRLEGQTCQSDQRNLLAAEYTLDEFGNPDKCGYDAEQAATLQQMLGDHWGYGYDDLLADLPRWGSSSYVVVDSIGASVQHRAIWELTITSDAEPMHPRQTVYIHARTHPGEVQAWWVTNEIINLLLSEDTFARQVREACVFHIIPLYNPDGVELEYARENANGVDIESNWNKSPVQPEVAVLRSRFQQLMNSAAPIKVALNMHSAYGTQRFFVYHDAAGTSMEYAALQKKFIEGIRTYFPGGIQPWNFFISWKTGTATQYPESWFWLNYREQVMALTYEDMNTPSAGAYDRTAQAIVRGIMDYLDGNNTRVVAGRTSLPADFSLLQNYPNPFSSRTTIPWQQTVSGAVEIELFDALGREVITLFLSERSPGRHDLQVNMAEYPSGLYFYRLTVNGATAPARRLLLVNGSKLPSAGIVSRL